jgi:branched-chain amino acid transport system permease protein
MKQLIKNAPFSIIAIAVLLLFALASPFLVDLSILGVLTKILIFGLFAMSLDLLVGYTALWSFGHAALFGAAAYTTGILTTHFDITNFWITLPASIVVTLLYSAVFGFISLRVSGIYFMLVTLALGEITYNIAFPFKKWTGGEDGIVNIPYPGFIDSNTGIYYFILVVCLACFAFLHYFVRSPFGQILKGIREDETRMKCLGYNVWLHKYIAFIVAGLFAGVAGILYAHYIGVLIPRDVGVMASGMPWLMVIIGGAGTLWGALIGSTIVLILQFYISLVTPQRWPLIMGAIYILVVMVARQGILVWIRDFIKKRKR